MKTAQTRERWLIQACIVLLARFSRIFSSWTPLFKRLSEPDYFA